MLCSLFVGIGANLPSARHGSPIDTCRWAVGRVVSISGLNFVGMSSWYRSGAIPKSDQPDYTNGVIQLIGTIEPDRLLQQLHSVEGEGGRIRGSRNAARVIDLDLLAVDDRVLHEAHLVVPHPRMAERAFVLHPFCDLSPEWRHPILRQTAAELRDRLPPQRIERLPDTTEDLLLRARTLT